MIVGLDVNQPIVIQNFNTEVLAISVDKLENKLHRLIPKVDKTSNWISAIGILIAIVLGIVSYACVEEEHRPSLGLVIPLLLIILVALVFTGYMLYKSYHSISVEEIITELKKEDSKVPKGNVSEQIVPLTSPKQPISNNNNSRHTRQLRKKKKGKKR